MPPPQRFKDRDLWVRGRWRPELLQLRDVPVVAVDLSGSQLTYDGLDNLGEPPPLIYNPPSTSGTPPG